MAALTYQATVQNENTVSVARSTDDAIGSAAAALIIDNTEDKHVIRAAISGLLRVLEFDSVNGSEVADYPTSGTRVV